MLVEAGIGFSLDAVARAAGVSKGGLLHHFPSREALIQGVVADLIGRFKAQVDAIHAAEIARHGARPGGWLRAYIEVSFQEDDPQEVALLSALAPVLSDPGALAALQGVTRPLLDATEASGLSPARAHAIRLACDGHWMSGLVALDSAQCAALKAELISWTR